MTKLDQLLNLRRLGLRTPRFRGLTYEAFLSGDHSAGALRFPLAVRSSFSGEDGAEKSMAGAFATRLGVTPGELPEAIAEVFAAYPDPSGQVVILQEMVEPDFSGVLFAFRTGVWKVEWGTGRGADLVGGLRNPEVLLLPRFSGADLWAGRFRKIWQGAGKADRQLDRALIRLSVWAGRLLRHLEAPHGLDIEFGIAGGQLFLFQARPLTTPAEAEEVLTTANHREILPPYPSRFMTAVITGAGASLWEYYRSADPSLGSRRFIEAAAGMPWINLSGLLDVMVHWGLPTALVCRSVGAQDVYGVALRPYRLLLKWRTLWRLFRRQRSARRVVRQWLEQEEGKYRWLRAERQELWLTEPEAAFTSWSRHFSALYVGLVNGMQSLTSAMSGPLAILQRMGVLSATAVASREKSETTDLYRAFRQLSLGTLNKAEFMERFGHRGFYESDIARPRFAELPEKEWAVLVAGNPVLPGEGPKAGNRLPGRVAAFLLAGPLEAVRTREWLRHRTMALFFQLRRELLEHLPEAVTSGEALWRHTPEELSAWLCGAPLVAGHTEQSGWDMDTFLCNRLERRLPLDVLTNLQGAKHEDGKTTGIGIFPGTVSGRVWRVASASPDHLSPPPYDRIILVADALDPGWTPFFPKVNGVISYVGGILSHASIVLRESGIPSVTQLPRQIELFEGDLVEMNGQTGEVRVIERNLMPEELTGDERKKN